MLRAIRKIKRWLNYRIHGSKKPWLDQLAATSPEQIFTHIFANNLWGDAESASGVGSNLVQTKILREQLPSLLRGLGVRSMLDIPCGDYYWLSQVELGVSTYIGADIVEELIRNNQTRFTRGEPGRSISFVKLNLLGSELPRVDLVLCRDCLVHFSNADVQQALRQIKQNGSTYLLTTTYPKRRNEQDIRTGAWRPINLQAAPFNLPKPTLTIHEGCTERNEL